MIMTCQKISAIRYGLDQMTAKERGQFADSLARDGSELGERLRALMRISDEVGPVTAVEILLAVIGKCSQ